MTVSELVLRAADALVAEFGTIAVEGEVSSFHHHGPSGHMYWTLKDRSAEVRCVMFRRDNQRLTCAVADGVHVVAIARPTIYRQRGQFQLEVTDVLPQGRGALYMQFEELRRKLTDEGLFDSGRKRALPPLPRRVGVVTSSAGAALRDIVSVLHRRAPSTEILVLPVPVQGREAAPEIAAAVRWFAGHPVVDVLIVGRGGGSIEDLWAFNDERVVRAIAASPIPVVSAVGHETDTTLADYAADVRAPTPSAAAEHVVPETAELVRQAVRAAGRMGRAIERQRQRRIEEALAPIRRYGFRRVRDRLREARQQWGDAVDRAAPAVAGRRDAVRLRVDGACVALPGPVYGALGRPREAVAAAARAGAVLARRHERVAIRRLHLEERLQAVSPLAILDRGYAIVTHAGAVVRRASTLDPGDEVEIRFSRGRAIAQVTERTNDRPGRQPGDEETE